MLMCAQVFTGTPHITHSARQLALVEWLAKRSVLPFCRASMTHPRLRRGFTIKQVGRNPYLQTRVKALNQNRKCINVTHLRLNR